MARMNQGAVQILEKIFQQGICTEKEILGMDLDQILRISKGRGAQIEKISELQKALREKRLLAHLCQEDIV